MRAFLLGIVVMAVIAGLLALVAIEPITIFFIVVLIIAKPVGEVILEMWGEIK